MRLGITLYFTIWSLNNCINVTVSGLKVCSRSSASALPASVLCRAAILTSVSFKTHSNIRLTKIFTF